MTSSVLVRCTDCHRRVVASEPLWLLGKPFGPRCGAKYGLKAEKRIRVRRPKRNDEMDQPVLCGLDDNEINQNGE